MWVIKYSVLRYAVIVVLTVLSLSCSSDGNIFNSEIDETYEREFLIQSGINRLKTEWQKAKVVEDVKPVKAEDMSHQPKGGWLIIFSDGSSISVLNAVDSATPFVRLDNESYWIVAYDGTNYDYLLDNNGEKIKAVPWRSKEEDEKAEEQEKGRCIRTITDSLGNYCFELYHPSNPHIVSETISVPFRADEGLAITSIVKDDNSGDVTFRMADGSQYTFALQRIVPSAIVMLMTDPILFTKPGERIRVDFRINPSNAMFNYNIESVDCQIKLCFVRGEDAMNYASYPVTLASITKAVDQTGNEIDGQYTAIFADTGENLFTYNEGAYLLLSFTDSNKETATVSSNVFKLSFDSTLPLTVKSEVPIIEITTPSAITSKDNWTDDCEITVFNAGDYSKTYTKVQMKGRGNSTWGAPKKPYAIKLDKKDEVLGFPKHKRWVLLANWLDKSNLRTNVAFKMGRMSADQSNVGLEYTPRIAFARVFMNGEFLGLYQVTEQLKIDDNRVNVGDDGFLLEIDGKKEDSDIFFNVAHIDQPIVIKDPDIEDSSDLQYIKDFLSKADEVLFSADFLDAETGYKNYIDIYSFIDWYLINEIVKNADACFYTSCYMNCKRGDKLKMGPLWDFDLAIGNYGGTTTTAAYINNPEGFWISGTSWIARMFQDPEFVYTVKERFNYFYDNRDEIYAELESQRDLIADVIHENEMVWHHFSSKYNRTITETAFVNECNNVKDWLEKRFTWMKGQFDAM